MKEKLTLFHFVSFIKIAEEGSMVKAAKILGVTQPMLSQKISQLEQALEGKLFLRTPVGLALTEKGVNFLQDITQIMDRLDVAMKAVAGSPVQELIRIGCSNGENLSRINEISENLKIAFPDTVFDFILDERPKLQEKLLSSEIDIFYMTDTEEFHKNKGLHYRTVAMTSLCAVTGRESQIQFSDPPSWKDLDQRVCYMPSVLKNSKLIADVRQLIRNQNLEFSIDFRDVDYFTIPQYVKMHDGFTITHNVYSDDPNLTLHHIGGLQYPFIIAWRKDNKQNLESYATKLFSLTQKQITCFMSEGV